MIVKCKVIGIGRNLSKRYVKVATELGAKDIYYCSFCFYSDDFQLDDQVDLEISRMQEEPNNTDLSGHKRLA